MLPLGSPLQNETKTITDIIRLYHIISHLKMYLIIGDTFPRRVGKKAMMRAAVGTDNAVRER